ncbi:MAG: hypothetical protein QOF76_5237, partial [Solirubrobacteraceae bacterium]|nr:hypothetical protein [Solirubrobacteraceae bacterium]
PKRLTSLGGGATPVLLYVGLLDDEKTAVCLVDAGVNVTGDGRCTPSGKDCQTLTLKVGETEFLTRGDKTWELDLVNIITKKTKDRAEANHALTEVAQTANKKTAQHAKRVSGYKYNAVTGFLAKSTPTAKTAAHHSSLAKTVGLTTSG